MAQETTSEEVFEGLVERYLANLGPTKRGKALIDRDLFAFILDTLRDPSDTTLGDSGERYWARAHFKLIRPAGDENGEVPGPNGDPLIRYFTINQKTRARTAEQPVAQRHEIYDIVKEAHERTNHGGRDKTYNAVKAAWSHIPKDLVTNFIKKCPTCCAYREEQGAKRDTKSIAAGTSGLLSLPPLPSPPRLPTPPPLSQPSTRVSPRQRFARPTIDECYDLPTPPQSSTLSTAVVSLPSLPPPPTPPTLPTCESPFLRPDAADLLSTSHSAAVHMPLPSPFRPRSVFDPAVDSPVSLLAESYDPFELLSNRSYSLTPSLSSSSSTRTPSTACTSDHGSDDFDPAFWLNKSIFDEEVVLTCAPTLLLSSFSTPLSQPRLCPTPTLPVQPRGTKRLASPFDDKDCYTADCPSKRSTDQVDCSPSSHKRRRITRASLA